MRPDTSTRHGTVSLDHKQSGPGHHCLTLFLCGHKGQRLGSQMREKLPLRCPACVQQDAGAKT